MRTRKTRLATAALLLGAAGWTGLTQLDRPRDTAPDAPAGEAVTALVHGSALEALRSVPPSFESVKGYRPEVEHGRLVKRSGGCSSPVPLPQSFTTACRQHDLGYDLLRVADASGDPLPASARRAVDDQLDGGMHRACSARTDDVGRWTCHGVADVAVAAVRINSWRQHGAVPGHETPVSVGAATCGLLTVGAGAGLAVRGGRAVLRRATMSAAAVAVPA